MSEMCRRAGKHRVGNIKIDKKIKEAETHREEKRGRTRLISAQTSSVHDYRDVCNYVSVNNETETPVSQALKIDPEHLTWLHQDAVDVLNVQDDLGSFWFVKVEKKTLQILPGVTFLVLLCAFFFFFGFALCFYKRSVLFW